MPIVLIQMIDLLTLLPSLCLMEKPWTYFQVKDLDLSRVIDYNGNPQFTLNVWILLLSGYIFEALDGSVIRAAALHLMDLLVWMLMAGNICAHPSNLPLLFHCYFTCHVEAAIHSMRPIFDEENSEGFLLVDASNAFNSLNRLIH